MLDVGCLDYSYGALAASALYHFSSCELMQKVSGKLRFNEREEIQRSKSSRGMTYKGGCLLDFLGYQLWEIQDCVKWMVPFAVAIKEVGSSPLKHFRGVPLEDLHNIQMHINTFNLLVSVLIDTS